MKNVQNLCNTIILSRKLLYPLESKKVETKISKRIIIISGPNKNKNQVTFGSNFNPGLDRVNTWVALFIRMEQTQLQVVERVTT